MKFLTVILVFVALFVLQALVCQWLWNWVAVDQGLKAIGLLDAFALRFLCGMLFQPSVKFERKG